MLDKKLLRKLLKNTTYTPATTDSGKLQNLPYTDFKVQLLFCVQLNLCYKLYHIFFKIPRVTCNTKRHANSTISLINQEILSTLFQIN